MWSLVDRMTANSSTNTAVVVLVLNSLLKTPSKNTTNQLQYSQLRSCSRSHRATLLEGGSGGCSNATEPPTSSE